MALVEQKIIIPLVDIDGRGKSREYSHDNLFELNFFKYLNSCGLSHAYSKKILKDVTSKGLLREKTIYIYDNDGKSTFTFDLSAIQARAHQGLEKKS